MNRRMGQHMTHHAVSGVVLAVIAVVVVIRNAECRCSVSQLFVSRRQLPGQARRREIEQRDHEKDAAQCDVQAAWHAGK